MPIHTQFPLTFEPIEIAGMVLPNRVIMGSMHTGLEETRGGFDKLAQFYRERAAGGAGLIVTGGISPDFRGRLAPHSTTLWRGGQVAKHRKVTDAVHAEGGRIAMQILHGGRYSHHPLSVAPSAIQAPIGRFKPAALSTRGVERTIKHFIRCALLARESGYDGVEVMGSEGYLINQFIAVRTNHRSDAFGGSLDKRLRFPLEIVSRIREACGPDFAIIYRLSMLDLVDEGSSWPDIVKQAKAIESAGASVINTGIGWHEARIPTIAAMVPRAGFAWVTRRLMGEVSVPLITTNRINDPTVIEQVLAEGCADMVSMARPFLADPAIVRKAFEGRSAEINTCIACNQACLDRIFTGQVAGCLVNPRAAKEIEWPAEPLPLSGRYAVVGAGPAGLSCASELARRGAEVHLFEAGPSIGGQFRLAQNVPGKDEFAHTLRYFSDLLERHGAKVHLNKRFAPEDAKGFDAVVLSTGVTPRVPKWADTSRPDVVTYDQVLRGDVKVGPRAAIIGSGGIGFDVADFLSHPHVQGEDHSGPVSVADFQKDWGVDPALASAGGLTQKQVAPSPRALWMFQRKTTKPGAGLGKTTGWIHRANVKNRGVQAVIGASYQKVDDVGLHYEIDGNPQVLKVDHVVLCAGQLSVLDIEAGLREAGVNLHIIGGAKSARGLDAERAISEGYVLARSFS